MKCSRFRVSACMMRSVDGLICLVLSDSNHLWAIGAV